MKKLVFIIFVAFILMCDCLNATVKVNLYNGGILINCDHKGGKSNQVLRISSNVNSWLYLNFENGVHVDSVEITLYNHMAIVPSSYDVAINGESDIMTLGTRVSTFPFNGMLQNFAINSVGQIGSYGVCDIRFFSANEEIDIVHQYKERIDDKDVVKYFNRIHNKKRLIETSRIKKVKSIYRRYIRRYHDREQRKTVDSFLKVGAIFELSDYLYETFKCNTSKFMIAHQELYATGYCWCNYMMYNNDYNGCYFMFGFKLDPYAVVAAMNRNEKVSLSYEDWVAKFEGHIVKGYGAAVAGLCNLQSEASSSLFFGLLTTTDPHAHYMALMGYRYFSNHQKAVEVATIIIEDELVSLSDGGRSKYGSYAVESAIEVAQINPRLSLQFLQDLYRQYYAVCPPSYDGLLCETEEGQIHTAYGSAEWIEQLILQANCKVKNLKREVGYKHFVEEIKANQSLRRIN